MNQSGAQRVTHLRTEYVQSREIAEKRNIKRRRGLIRRLTAFAVIFTVACSAMLSVLNAQGRQLDQAVSRQSSLEKQISASQDDVAQLKERIQRLHDKKYIGEIARRDYLMSDSDKGEIIFSKPAQEEH